MGNMISESDTRVNFIDPKLADSQWHPIHIVREHYLPMVESCWAIKGESGCTWTIF